MVTKSANLLLLMYFCVHFNTINIYFVNIWTNSFEAGLLPTVKWNGKGHILLSEVRCSGAETSLAQCLHRGYYSHDCDHSQDVGVICMTGRKVTYHQKILAFVAFKFRASCCLVTWSETHLIPNHKIIYCYTKSAY